MIALALALAVLAAQAAPADPIAAAAAGLSPAEIEDDNGPDMPLTAISSAGCMVTIIGRDAAFAVDMRQSAAVALEDTFVFVKAGTVQLAIVGDASRSDQAAKLKALATALVDLATKCEVRR